jgi:hypothetical protein
LNLLIFFYNLFIEKGFIFAYEELLDAIEQKDSNYLSELFEPKLYATLVKGFKESNEKNWEI